jgi:hypothetical protein
VFELRRGSATKDWIEICQPVLRTIIDATQSLELDDLARRLGELEEALALAQSSDGRTIPGECRDLILSCYDELVDSLPGAFELDEDDRRRESIIIHSLLRQMPEVGRVTLEKLYGAGLTSLDALFLATPADLSVASGVPQWLCQGICDKVKLHRESLEGASPEHAQLDQQARLVGLVKELQRLNETFHRVSNEENPELAAQKRDALRNRKACALQINVLLAEMGEVELVEELNKLAVERRIDKLAQFMRSMPPPPAVPATHAMVTKGSNAPNAV